jgi:hypothetical protein
MKPAGPAIKREEMTADDWTEPDQALEAFEDTVSSLITEDFKAVEKLPCQNTIYHYTDVKGALGI